MLVGIAWVVLVLNALNVLIMPLAIGKERQPYTYANYIGSILQLALIVPLCFKAMGLI